MKSLLRSLVVAALPLLAALPPLSAQTSNQVNVRTGGLAFSLDSVFVDRLANSGIHLKAVGFSFKDPTFPHLPIEGGVIDIANGDCEFASTGSLIWTSGRMVFEISRLTLEMIPGGQSLTGLVSLNGIMQGRMTIFTVVSGNPIPIPVPAGVFTTTNIYFQVAEPWQKAFNSFFQTKLQMTGPIVGAVSLKLDLR